MQIFMSRKQLQKSLLGFASYNKSCFSKCGQIFGDMNRKGVISLTSWPKKKLTYISGRKKNSLTL